MRGGGDGSRSGSVGVAPLGSLWKNFKMPFSFFSWMSPSSSDGAGEREEIDESSLESSSAILGGGTWLGNGWCWRWCWW